MYIITIIFAAALATLVFAVPTQAGGHFSFSCPYSFLASPALLTSVCWRSNGDERTTELDLNKCIGNDNGNLRWSYGYGGNYAKSCFGCVLNIDDSTNGLQLACQCLDVSWKSKSSIIQLDERIGNLDGWQECFGNYGSANVDTSYRKKK